MFKRIGTHECNTRTARRIVDMVYNPAFDRYESLYQMKRGDFFVHHIYVTKHERGVRKQDIFMLTLDEAWDWMCLHTSKEEADHYVFRKELNRVTIMLDEDQLDWIDHKRGLDSRIQWFDELIYKMMKEDKKDE